jgi:hypothetical protein
MVHDLGAMTCEEFQDRLPELIGSVGGAVGHPHLRSCVRCRALLDDLESIAEAARQLLPTVEPSDELWKHIESALKDTEEPSKPG